MIYAYTIIICSLVYSCKKPPQDELLAGGRQRLGNDYYPNKLLSRLSCIAFVRKINTLFWREGKGLRHAISRRSFSRYKIQRMTSTFGRQVSVSRRVYNGCISRSALWRSPTLKSVVSSGLGAARVGRQHLVEEFVGHAALDKFLFCEDAVVVFVHLVEDLLSATSRSVVRVAVRKRRADHVEDGLQRSTERKTPCKYL